MNRGVYLAGVLAAMGRAEAALPLYEGVALTVEDRYRLAGLYSSAKRYEAAAAECRQRWQLRIQARAADSL